MPRTKQTSRHPRPKGFEPVSTTTGYLVNRHPTSFARDLSPASSVVPLSDREVDNCVATMSIEADATMEYGHGWLKSPMPSISTHQDFLPRSKGTRTHTGLPSSRYSMTSAHASLPIQSTEKRGFMTGARRETDSHKTTTRKDFPGGFESTIDTDLDRTYRDSSEEIPLPANIKQSTPIDLTGADGTAPLVGKRKRKRKRLTGLR